jgi:hypothetical protein
VNTNRKALAIAIAAVLIFSFAMTATVLAAKPGPGNNGTTLAGYKTIDICSVNDATWRYSGEIAVWNEGAIDTVGLNITDFIEYKPGNKWIKAYDMPITLNGVATPPFAEIAAGTTLATATVYQYTYDGAVLPGTIRNNASLTILNHSAHLGKPYGPNPKATYDGTMPPPPCEKPMGCTLTQGYWGTHSKYGPAERDATWDSVGEDTPFFLSGTTWYGAITTNPAGGNGYWILSNQYVAAILNQAKGAYVPSGVQDTLNLATAWFNANAPSACDAKGSCGLQKDWAATLDHYNNGLYPGGPPHCE